MAKRLTEYERAEAIKDYVRGNPGASSTEIGRNIPGEYTTVSRALSRLIGLGRIVARRDFESKTMRHYAKDEPTR